MAGGGDIRAGRAYVELYIKNSALMRGLKDIQTRLNAMGSSVLGFGARIAGMGAALLAPFIAAIKHFTDVGSALNDMSARTGVSVQALAELGYAASMTGSNLEEVEGAIKKMQKAVAGDSDVIKALGLDPAKLKAMKPEDQFQAVADAIASISDPTERAAAAMSIFGKSGTQLLPMIENLREAREEARRLGLVPTDEAVKAADALGDAFDKVKATIGAAFFKIGAALAPVLLPAAEAIAKIVAKIGFWIEANPKLVQTIAGIGAGLLAAGTLIMGLGAGVIVAGAAFGGVATIVGVVGTVLGAILSPVGLVVTGIVGATSAFLTFTQTGRGVVAFFADSFKGLWTTVSDTLSYVAKALLAGDIEGAAEVMWAGLNIIWLENTQSIRQIFTDVWASIQSAFVDVTSTMAQIWDGFYTTIANGIIEMQRLWVDGVRAIGEATGIITPEFSQQWRSELDAMQKKINSSSAAIEADRQSRQAMIEADRTGSLSQQAKELMKARAEFAKAKAAVAGWDEQGTWDGGMGKGGGGGPPGPNELGSHVFGTFSATAAALSEGGVGGIARRQLQRAGQQVQLLADANAALDKIKQKIWNPVFGK